MAHSAPIAAVPRTAVRPGLNAPSAGPWRGPGGPGEYPERFAQQALGHNWKVVHYAYSKHAEVTVPSLDEWEKQWQENPQRMEKPKVLAVDFHGVSGGGLETARGMGSAM
jgi:hypothetical protein